MTTAWSHLPNAKHIDRIIADLNANTDNWVQAWTRAMTAAWDAAWTRARTATRDAAWTRARTATRDAARDAVYSAARDAVYSAARDAARHAAWHAASYAILALIAWPEASDYLDLSTESLQVLAALGDHKAVLILPAAIAFESEKELV